MDFMQPNTLWINERCYRVLNSNVSTTSNYIEDDLYPTENNTYKDELECGEVDIPIEQLKNGKFTTSLAIPSVYYPYIIGGKGSTKRRIETETTTQIRIPGKGKSGDIVILGQDIRTVKAARLKLELLADQARKRQPFTHFLSLPIVSDNIQEGFLKFQNEVLERCSDCRGVDKSLFQSAAKLHLTLCVMVLADDRERQQVIDVVEQCHSSIVSKKIGREAIKVEMRGIEYMNDDPGEVDVLYGKIVTCSSSIDLQDISDTYADHLIQAGVIHRQYEQVKLHVTLMNTLFRKDAEGSVEIENGPKSQRESFDARRILEDFKDFDFGSCNITDLHISVRFSTDRNGYYKASKVFNFT